MPLKNQTLYKNFIRQITETDEFLNPADVINSWSEALTLRCEDIEKEIKGLRNPQLGGIYSSLSHWTYSNDVATVVMPTGTGKTETMLSLMLLTKCPKLLVIVPTDSLRDQISRKFISLGLLKNEIKVLNEDALNPVVGILKSKFVANEEATDFIDRCNVIVATASILSRMTDDILDIFVDKFSHVFIDEAHHAEANTWFKIRDKFKAKKVLQFTATPYRNDGKRSKVEIIYSYPLKKAQKEGYFKEIQFKPIEEYDSKLVDKSIADKAVSILREDRKTYPHILLARVATKKRADEVFEIYEQYAELKVAKIYSGIPDKENIKRAIINKEYEVIVCVDMLGEGFDLPELKIAAFHDVKKSLPTTIQFVGRFTRTKHDEELGSAKIVVNLADLKVKDELDELYAQDNDWNELLPRISEGKTKKEKDFQETVSGFNNIEDFFISLHNLKPAISTVIYKNHTNGWNVEDFETELDKNCELSKVICNEDKKICVGIKVEKLSQKWTDSESIFDLTWSLYVIHWNQEQGLLFIHSSDNKSLHEDIAEIIVGEKAQIINGEDGGQIFRCLDGISRFTLKNLGLIQLLGKLIRFQMSVGTDIEPALSKAQISQAKKSHVFGVGFEFGRDVSLGCAYKGRVWTQLQDDIDSFIKWCANVGNKILDETIDAEQVLRGAIVPKSVSERPPIFPICIDWNNEMYKETETRFKFKIGENEFEFYNSDLVLIDPSEKGDLKFGVESYGNIIAQFELQLYRTEQDYDDFRIVKTFPEEDVFICYGRQEQAIEKFFYKYTPEIWFADGSVLEGVSFCELKEEIEPYEIDKINFWNWDGIDLSKEAQKINPKLKDSIQFRCIENLKKSDYDIIYDDDYSGEIADVIAMKITDEKIQVDLFHLKYAKDGEVSGRIDNLYEVCGQAQKSVHWKFKEGRDFVDHLLRRKVKKREGEECSRIEKGSEDDISKLYSLAKRKFPMNFKIHLVQPAITRKKLTQDQLTLLAVTENYLKAKGIELEVIGNDIDK
jgi:superfamily II DNA or RNA helicase